ncbi:MAG: diaminopimelate epimerase [Candidatus Omnitrophota bacterium]
MKKIAFVKMVAAGNDFVIAENLKGNLAKLAKEICQRKTGIGADGLLVLEKSRRADYKMRVFNPDGSEAEMCGNGARCMALYISKAKKIKRQHFVLETLSGLIEAKVEKDNSFINMGIPQDIKLEVALNLTDGQIGVSSINTGVPHAVVFPPRLREGEVISLGREIRYHPKFAPRGTNVDFVEPIKRDLIKVRTYERGVENETLACGSGSVAAAIITFLKNLPSRKKGNFTMQVLTLSTEILKVHFDFIKEKIFNVWLEGKARMVCKGEYYV